MFEAIVPADDNDIDDRVVTTTSFFSAQSGETEEEKPQELSLSGQGSVHYIEPSNGHQPVQQLTVGPIHNMPVPFFPFSPEESPTPLGPGPNLQNTAEISSPEQVPLPSSTVSALPVPDTISPEFSLPLPAHYFQQIPGFQFWFSSTSSPCDSTSGGFVTSPLLTAPLSSSYLPGAVIEDQCYQEL